ncbi:hypothetical protein GOP47_0011773 [Adiantum capillus-veneris]|uniref:Uncharacterized protein n=1 Tax=Adiantum capillus-veneris TaxID=13818 RepID=A0A9D4UTY2_ADICA|nr:hypothetical protein GOP47_0011773 [Adiantum capillus-veneris]
MRDTSTLSKGINQSASHKNICVKPTITNASINVFALVKGSYICTSLEHGQKGNFVWLYATVSHPFK